MVILAQGKTWVCFRSERVNLSKNMSKNIGKIISKNVSGKYSQKRLDHIKQCATTDALKTTSKQVI